MSNELLPRYKELAFLYKVLSNLCNSFIRYCYSLFFSTQIVFAFPSFPSRSNGTTLNIK